jgi:hypothetical protein
MIRRMEARISSIVGSGGAGFAGAWGWLMAHPSKPGSGWTS